MYGWMRAVNGWQLMGHGNLFAQFLLESGEIHRRSHQFGSINWAMGSAKHAFGPGQLTLRTMLSAEPWTIRGCGYPDLLATGEICSRDTIHDRQHPHDLFMELAATYDQPLGEQHAGSSMSRLRVSRRSVRRRFPIGRQRFRIRSRPSRTTGWIRRTFRLGC